MKLKDGVDKLCDGRLAKNKKGEPVPCKETNKKFWFCQYLPCYKPNMTDHNEDYHDYSLWNLLEIIGKSLSEDEYGIIVGNLNKLTSFIEHLQCRECKRFLSPLRQSNYAFDRINEYICRNDACSLSMDIHAVYITHCLNPYCKMVIDSRDNKFKCQHTLPSGKQSGWYVCIDCNACCSDNSINKRKEAKKRTDQEYNGPEKGHKDQGIIFCAVCGEHIKIWELKELKDKYKTLYNWFSDSKRVDKILKKGIREDGGWWVLLNSDMFSPESLEKHINKFRKFGLTVKTDRAEEILISEPYYNGNKRKVGFICSNESCSNSIGFWAREQKSRYQAMLSFFVGKDE